jgi:hypothetical protein
MGPYHKLGSNVTPTAHPAFARVRVGHMAETAPQRGIERSVPDAVIA